MQKLIEKSGLTIKEFSELYEIPYNTIRQWANGTRKAPEWTKKLIEKIIELRSKDQKQLQIELSEEFEKEFIKKTLTELIKNNIFDLTSDKFIKYCQERKLTPVNIMKKIVKFKQTEEGQKFVVKL